MISQCSHVVEGRYHLRSLPFQPVWCHMLDDSHPQILQALEGRGCDAFYSTALWEPGVIKPCALGDDGRCRQGSWVLCVDAPPALPLPHSPPSPPTMPHPVEKLAPGVPTTSPPPMPSAPLVPVLAPWLSLPPPQARPAEPLRPPFPISPNPPSSPPALPPPATPLLCSNECRQETYSYTYNGHHWRALDGECQDGGEGAVLAFCALGTDCADCGPRAAPPPRPPLPPTQPPVVPLTILCSDECEHPRPTNEAAGGGRTQPYSWRLASDGICNDGGEGAYGTTRFCTLGTDCSDCGPRLVLPPQPPPFPSPPPRPPEPPSRPPAPPTPPAPPRLPPSPASPPGVLCSNECRQTTYSYTYNGHHWRALDGECQDGGEGAVLAFCALGTDCADCGPREIPFPDAPPSPGSAPLLLLPLSSPSSLPLSPVAAAPVPLQTDSPWALPPQPPPPDPHPRSPAEPCPPPSWPPLRSWLPSGSTSAAYSNTASTPERKDLSTPSPTSVPPISVILAAGVGMLGCCCFLFCLALLCCGQRAASSSKRPRVALRRTSSQTHATTPMGRQALAAANRSLDGDLHWQPSRADGGATDRQLLPSSWAAHSPRAEGSTRAADVPYLVRHQSTISDRLQELLRSFSSGSSYGSVSMRDETNSPSEEQRPLDETIETSEESSSVELVLAR